MSKTHSPVLLEEGNAYAERVRIDYVELHSSGDENLMNIRVIDNLNLLNI